jgi:hypothetical protein
MSKSCTSITVRNTGPDGWEKAWGSLSLDRDQGSEIRDQKNAGWGGEAGGSPISENPDMGHPSIFGWSDLRRPTLQPLPALQPELNLVCHHAHFGQQRERIRSCLVYGTGDD